VLSWVVNFSQDSLSARPGAWTLFLLTSVSEIFFSGATNTKQLGRPHRVAQQQTSAVSARPGGSWSVLLQTRNVRGQRVPSGWSSLAGAWTPAASLQQLINRRRRRRRRWINRPASSYRAREIMSLLVLWT
jgi:hypothetical protein